MGLERNSGDAKKGGGSQTGESELRFDGRLIHQHDGDVFFDRVHSVALGAFQAFRVLPVFKRLLAGRTNQDFQ